MDQKIVVVTGATRGLGLAIAQRLAEEGYKVIGTGRKLTPELDALMKEDAVKGRIEFRTLDLSKTDTIRPFAQELMKSIPRLYGLVNNAGVAHDGVLATLHETDVIEMIGVNITGTILLTKYLVRPMLLNKRGCIINVSSIIASTGFNGLSVYGATKAALIGFSKSLARELGRANIRVNAIAPGYMETNMSAGLNEDQLASIVRRTPLGHLVTVKDVAGSVVFLLSDDAAMMTGTVLTVDGGSIA